MRRSLTVAALTLVALCVPAAAEDYRVIGQFGYYGVGHATEIEKDHLYWTGEFSGTFFNDKGPNSLFDRAGVKCPAFNDLEIAKKKNHAGGYCIIEVGSPADQAFAKWSCEGDVDTCTGTFEYIGGTGKFQSASGSNTFKATNTAPWKDGNISGVATWNR